MLPQLGRAVATLTLCALAHGAPYQPADDPAGHALLQEAQRAISAYHAGHATPEAARARLRVVYFHPSDRDPLPDYEARLDRVLTDISDFYRDGLRRFGIENDGIALERKDGRIVLHLVRGKHPASAYTYESGDETAAEARAALKGVVDFDHEFVLIIYGLCRREPDGRYVFDSPYYGASYSNHRRGLCHAADCELLDPGLLTETKRKMVFTEHYYPRREESFASFNTLYLGGVAHELGHGLGLPHDSGHADEKRFGTSLMGLGNHTYRNDRWGGRDPAFLSRSSALQLAAHPLVTGSNRGRDKPVRGAFDQIQFANRDRTLQISGKTTGEIPAHAVVAHFWPASLKNNHGAQTVAATVSADGKFSISLADLGRAPQILELKSFHVNGDWTSQRFRLEPDGNGLINTAQLNASWIVRRVETAVLAGDPQARRLLGEKTPAGTSVDQESLRKLEVLRGIVEPVLPLDLATLTDSSAFLSDVNWTAAKVGWGEVRRNHFWFSENFDRGVFLKLEGRFYDEGLYAHSPSRYAFALDGTWKTFTATIGLRDGATKQGSAVFTINGDGRELYRSAILRPGSTTQASANLTGVKQLELIAEGGEGHAHNSWAVWLDPQVSR
ncbi:MAG: NPCBM/NEW2 domain-containing protein [Verrucomicrobiota bacterium]